ncbi:MAG: FtsX-like permease family protein [Patescibacteria group bacterium]
MFYIAIKNLFQEKTKLLISVGGVAFSVILILILLGLFQGWQRQMTKFLGNIQTDFWVGQKGSRDLSHSISILPSSLQNQIAEESYVDQVTPFIGRQVSFQMDGKDTRFFLVGIDNKQVVRPYKIIEGANFPESGEIIVDNSFASAKKKKIGDIITINNHDLEISGISLGGNLMIYTYALVNIDQIRDILDFKDLTNYYLIRSSNPELAKTEIETAFPDLEIITKQTFLANNASIISDTFLPIIGVLLAIAVAVGVAVIGLTIFTATIEKAREYGVLKAIGVTNGQLYHIALVQSIISGVIGFILGIILVPIIVKIAETFASGFIYEAGFKETVGVLIVTLIMSILASIIPLKRLTSIDPAEVFKS